MRRISPDAAAYKLLPLHYRFHCGGQFITRIRLHHITVSAFAESCLRDIYINFLTQEEYFGLGGDYAAILRELRNDETSPRNKIIYQEDTDKRVITYSVLLI